MGRIKTYFVSLEARDKDVIGPAGKQAVKVDLA
jgi:hypothetical protein